MGLYTRQKIHQNRNILDAKHIHMQMVCNRVDRSREAIH